jgi:hypothetical protein
MYECSTCPVEEQCTWSPLVNDLVQSIARSAHVWSMMHRGAVRYHEEFNKYLGVPAVVLSALTTSAAYATSWTTWMAYITCACAMLSNVSLGLYAKLQPKAKAKEHIGCENMANELCDELRHLLTKPHATRPDATTLIPHIQIKLSKVRNGPSIPQSVVNRQVIALEKAYQALDFTVDSEVHPDADAPENKMTTTVHRHQKSLEKLRQLWTS